MVCCQFRNPDEALVRQLGAGIAQQRQKGAGLAPGHDMGAEQRRQRAAARDDPEPFHILCRGIVDHVEVRDEGIALQHRGHHLRPRIADEAGHQQRRRIVHDGDALGEPDHLMRRHARQQQKQRVRRQHPFLRLQPGGGRHQFEQDDCRVACLLAGLTLTAGRRWHVGHGFRGGLRSGLRNGGVLRNGGGFCGNGALAGPEPCRQLPEGISAHGHEVTLCPAGVVTAGVRHCRSGTDHSHG